jgi:hypothetical protein
MKDIKETAKRLNVSEEEIKSVIERFGQDVTDDEILEALTSANAVSKPALKSAPSETESHIETKNSTSNETNQEATGEVISLKEATVEEAREQARYQAALFAKNYKETFDAETERLLAIHLDIQKRDFDKYVDKELSRPAVKVQPYKKKARPSLDYKAMGLM